MCSRPGAESSGRHSPPLPNFARPRNWPSTRHGTAIGRRKRTGKQIWPRINVYPNFSLGALVGLEAALRSVAAVATELDLRWYVFGAQATIVYGVPRATADVDVTIEPPDDVEELVVSLKANGLQLQVEDPVTFVAQTSVLPAVHESGFPVDIVIGRSGLEDEFLSRAQLTMFAPGFDVPVITPEDLVVSKVLAGRPKDLSDAEAVFRSTKDLDVSRVTELLRALEEALGVSDLIRIVESWTGRD